METKDFIALVAQMRTNQKAYFKTRSYEALNESKRRKCWRRIVELLLSTEIEKL